MSSALTDAQLAAIQQAAAILHPHDRGPYLEKVAELLNGREIGDGLVARAAREAQRQFLRTPRPPNRHTRHTATR